MISVFQGDPRLILTVDGSKLKFIAGQPVLDPGLENMALIALFTRRGWAGNVLFADINQHIGSDFEKATEQPITLRALNEIRDAAIKALSYPVFGNVTVDVENPVSSRLNIFILIEPPGQDILQLNLQKNGLNWIAQAFYPAYRRI